MNEYLEIEAAIAAITARIVARAYEVDLIAELMGKSINDMIADDCTKLVSLGRRLADLARLSVRNETEAS